VAPVLVALAAIGLVTVALSRLRPLSRALRSRRFITLGRVGLTLVVLIAVPSFVTSVADILGRPI